MNKLCRLAVILLLSLSQIILYANASYAGTISGRVTDATNGRGVEGAAIKVFNQRWTWLYRVYTDGRDAEVIRGVDIVGTPLTSFARITATGNDYGIFNGTCGAESGWVPVSAISPSVLVSEVEIEKKAKEQERPPLLPPPYDPDGSKSLDWLGGVR